MKNKILSKLRNKRTFTTEVKIKRINLQLEDKKSWNEYNSICHLIKKDPIEKYWERVSYGSKKNPF